ncbi:hypothetical protein EB796_021021 [Bugula neritina]|uniref:DUF4371 domain-containing protein n=1 Tax=Bugula neritina TaxID=10212 RepID=A0A7J7J4T4_BUGNE|nr:hypothetical protein EB796_021021 [Bugula neritina]
MSLSNNTVKRHIDDFAADIEEKIKESPFSIQLANISQLLVYSMYVHDKSIEEEFMFCQPLLTTTSAVDVMQLVDQHFEKSSLMWKNVTSVCTDAAPAMLGSRSGFVQLARKENPDMEDVHCFIMVRHLLHEHYHRQ